MENFEFERELSELGIDVSFERVWVGTPGADRHWENDRTKIESVTFNFTPDEWSRLVVCDGDEYIGPCCGTTGAMQDIICGVHRAGGAIQCYEFKELGFLGASHDGMEWWSEPVTKEALDERIAERDGLSLWDRIGVAYQACSSFMRESSVSKSKPTPADLESGDGVLNVVRNGLRLLHWGDVIGRPEGTGPKFDADRFQAHANRQVLVSRVIPAARKLVETLEREAGEPIDAVCLVQRDNVDVPLQNGYGLTVYKDAEQVRVLFGTVEKILIRPCRVSMERGLEFTDEAREA
jgi:hypothetical protein